MDEHWEKMSKSKGNGLDPLKIMAVYGADVLRLWAALTDYQQDVRISESIIKTISDQYRKIRNTFRFMLGNLSNGSIEDTFKNEDKFDTFEQIDLFILARLEEVKNKVIDSMNDYNFINGTGEILKFLSDDLSSFYLDIAKDILYCEEKGSLRRRQVQTVLNECCFTLMRLLNPIIPFTMDEVNQNYPLKSKENVMYYDYPTKSNNYDPSLIKNYQLVKEFRDEVLKTLENTRNNGEIGSAQEALLTLKIKSSELKEEIKKFSKDELARLFIVSEVKFDDSLNENESNLTYSKVTKHPGVKCDRCWNYFDEKDIKEVEGVHLCPRCSKALKK